MTDLPASNQDSQTFGNVTPEATFDSGSPFLGGPGLGRTGLGVGKSASELETPSDPQVPLFSPSFPERNFRYAAEPITSHKLFKSFIQRLWFGCLACTLQLPDGPAEHRVYIDRVPRRQVPEAPWRSLVEVACDRSVGNDGN